MNYTSNQNSKATKQSIDSTFQTFSPNEYLTTYYSHIGSENDTLLQFYAETYKNIRLPKDAILLEFGGGPTIYPLISAAPVVNQIYFAEYLPQNRKAVEDWITGKPEAFDWKPFIRRSLEIETGHRPSLTDISKREKLVKEKITCLLPCDAFQTYPLGENQKGSFPVINVNFVPESITNNKNDWKRVVRNICSLLPSSGTLLMSAITGAQYYHAGKKSFPATPIEENDMRELLPRLGFSNIQIRSIPAEITDVMDADFTGYTGMIFVQASRT